MDIQKPDFLKNMKGPARWEWFDRQKEIMAKAIAENKAVELKPETIKGFLYMSQVQDDKYCQLVSMHNNAVVVAACAAIEQDKDASHEWLLNMLDQADCAEWQMYSNAQEFYDRNHLPFPLTQAEHRKNMEKLRIIEKEDAEKFEIWYEQNVMAQLKAQEQKGMTIKKLLAAIHSDLSLDSAEEIKANIELIARVQEMSAGERETIKAAFSDGPLYDGDVPSKSSRDILVKDGFIAKVVVKGEDGFNACTYKGRWAYRILKAMIEAQEQKG